MPAFGQVEHEGHALLLRAFEECRADQHRDTAAVFADKFLFVRGARAGAAHFRRFLLIERAVCRWGETDPLYFSGQQILATIPDHGQESVVGLADAALQIKKKDTDDVGFDQMPDACFPFPQRFLCALSLDIFLLQIGIELGVFERDGSLAGQQFQYFYPARGEGMGGKIVFQVKQADQRRLSKNRQAQHGLVAPLQKVRVCRKRVRFGGIHQQHRLPAAPDIIENWCGQGGMRLSLPEVQAHLHRLLVDAGIGGKVQFFVSDQEQTAGLRTGVFEHDAHERVDQLVQNDLAGDRLRGFGDC